MIPFVKDFPFEYGVVEQVSPLIQRLIARNPGPFTFAGTGTYIIGRLETGAGVAVIDPGPIDDEHLSNLTAAVADRIVTHVLITHTHRDHAPLARPFAETVNAEIHAASPPPRTIHASAALDEDEDEAFSPDRVLMGGEVLHGDGWTVEAMATPGHASNHMAFILKEENAFFSGDHVMGWSTTVVAPPDGDMTDYMASLDAVIDRDFTTIWPTHGAPIREVGPFLRAYRSHRMAREAQIVARLSAGAQTISEIVPALYGETDRRLWPAATLSVWAHLIALERSGQIKATPAPTMNARWRLI